MKIAKYFSIPIIFLASTAAFCIDPSPAPTAAMLESIALFGKLSSNAIGENFDSVRTQLLNVATPLGLKCREVKLETICDQANPKISAFAQISLSTTGDRPTGGSGNAFRLKASFARGVFIPSTTLTATAFSNWTREASRSSKETPRDCIQLFRPSNHEQRAHAALELAPHPGGCFYPSYLTIDFN